MSITKRQQEILKILNEKYFSTVNELAKITFTSPSSIRRDLTAMQNKGLVKRTHGGVSMPDRINGVASFYDRRNKNKNEKRAIAKKAASLLEEGQSIMLDSSSTVEFLLPYIAKFEDITLFTNNLKTALSAIELGINTHCLGGKSINGSVALTGAETCNALNNITVDILFFSSQFLDKDGNISDTTEEENYIRSLMIKSAKKTTFLCDSEKFGKTSLYKLCNIKNIDFAVFDKPYHELTSDVTIL